MRDKFFSWHFRRSRWSSARHSAGMSGTGRAGAVTGTPTSHTSVSRRGADPRTENTLVGPAALGSALRASENRGHETVIITPHRSVLDYFAQPRSGCPRR